jgi:hypothetical protein
MLRKHSTNEYFLLLPSLRKTVTFLLIRNKENFEKVLEGGGFSR